MNPGMSMRWTYDPQADAIYLTLKAGTLTEKLISVGISDHVILDVDQDGHLAGIEIIGATLAFTRLRRVLADEPTILGGSDALG